MASNTITIHGKLGKEPDLRYTGSQMAVVEFSVATTSGKDDKKKTTWFEVKVFGQLAENVANTLTKGDNVVITGRMETDEYTKKDGTQGKFTSLIADEVGASCRWNAWVKDQTNQTVARIGTVGKAMPTASTFTDEEPF